MDFKHTENPMKELQTAQNTNHKMASRRTLKDFFNRRRDHSEEIAREGGQESFQGEFSSMDSFMQVLAHSTVNLYLFQGENG